MEVQTQVKRIRLGLDVECFDDREIIDKDDGLPDDDPNKEQHNMDDVDTTERYDVQHDVDTIERYDIQQQLKRPIFLLIF